MRTISSRPTGSRTRGFPSVKLRGIHLGGRPDRSYPNGWASFWDEEYDEVALNQDVDLAISLGANCVKLMADVTSYIAGGADLIRMKTRLRDFLTYTTEQKILVAWAQPIPEWPEETPIEDIRDAIVEIARDLNDFSNVINFDCLNEINFYTTPSQAAENCAGFFPSIRSVTRIPLTASFSGSPNTLEEYVEAVDEWVDFYDFHLYSMGSPALLDDYLALIDRPFLIGEFGLSGYSDSESLIQQIEDFALPVSAFALCYGGILFPQYDAPDLDAGYPGLVNVVSGPNEDSVAAFESLPNWT